LAYYDPETQVVVLVFLLSSSQNSAAFWKRRVRVPASLRAEWGHAIREKTAEIDERGMVIRVESTQFQYTARA